MVWSAFSGLEKSSVALLDGCQNSEMYCETLLEQMLPYSCSINGDDFALQRGCPTIHTSHFTRNW